MARFDSSKQLALLAAFLYPILSIGISYVAYNGYLRLSSGGSFRYLLSGPPDYSLLYAIELYVALPVFLTLILYAFTRRIPLFLPTLLYEAFWVLYALLFVLSTGGLAGVAGGFILLSAVSGGVASISFLYLWTRLWPYNQLRKRGTLVLFGGVLLLYLALFVEARVTSYTTGTAIEDIEVLPATATLVSKEEYDSIATVASPTISVDAKDYVGRTEYVIRWVDEDRFLFGRQITPALRELWVRNVRTEERFQLTPTGIVGGGQIDPPIISPDRNWVAFADAFVKALGEGGVFLAKLDGTRLVRLDAPVCGKDREKYGAFEDISLEGGPPVSFSLIGSCFNSDMRWGEDGIYILVKSPPDPDIIIKVEFTLPVVID